jgi:hypothetical protein
VSVTPDKSALAQARERLERAYKDAMHVAPGAPTVASVQAAHLRLVLDALKEAERERPVVNATIAYWKRSDAQNWTALAIAIHAILRERGEMMGGKAPADHVGEIVSKLRSVLAGGKPPPFRWNVFVEQSDLIALLNEIEGARFAHGLKSAPQEDSQ